MIKRTLKTNGYSYKYYPMIHWPLRVGDTKWRFCDCGNGLLDDETKFCEDCV